MEGTAERVTQGQTDRWQESETEETVESVHTGWNRGHRKRAGTKENKGDKHGRKERWVR